MQHDGGAGSPHRAYAEPASASAPARPSGGIAVVCIGRGHFGFNVLGVCGDVIDERSRRVEARGPDMLARAELRNVGIKKPAYIDDGIAVVIRGNVECLNNSVVVGVLHGLGDGFIRLRRHTEINVAKIDPIIAKLPGDHPVGNLPTAIPGADRGLGDLGIPEVLFAQFALRNLVVEPLTDLMDREQSLLCLGFLINHAIVRAGGSDYTQAPFPPPARPPPPPVWGGSSWARGSSPRTKPGTIAAGFASWKRLPDSIEHYISRIFKGGPRDGRGKKLVQLMQPP